MNVAGDVAEACEEEVDEEVGATACDHEDADWWEEEGDYDY